jgi:hypothetical protein
MDADSSMVVAIPTKENRTQAWFVLAGVSSSPNIASS